MSKTPTVGQSVHYYRNAGAKPLAGVIAAVVEGGKVNLGCLDVNGVPYAYGQKDVTLLQDGEDTPDKGGWCEYPPTDDATPDPDKKPESEKAEPKQPKDSAKSEQQKDDAEGDSKDAKAKAKK